MPGHLRPPFTKPDPIVPVNRTHRNAGLTSDLLGQQALVAQAKYHQTTPRGGTLGLIVADPVGGFALTHRSQSGNSFDVLVSLDIPLDIEILLLVLGLTTTWGCCNDGFIITQSRESVCKYGVKRNIIL